MFFAFFTACVVNTATGAVDCASSYTEMTSVMRKGETCEAAATILQTNAVAAVELLSKDLIVTSVRRGCGTKAQVRAEAEMVHNSYVAVGIRSDLFEF